MKPILVPGTWAWKDNGAVDWYVPGHPFGVFLTQQGYAPTYDGPRPFVWSTNLAGIPWLTNKRDWAAAGHALADMVIARLRCASDATALIVHSHGLQVAAYAAAECNLKIAALISVGSPIRKDLTPQYAALRANTRYWLHVHSDRSDRFEWFGELFDGHLGIVRDTPLADRNDTVPKVGHSELLRDPQQYHFWLERRWLDALAGAPVAAA